jgi:hypothetical protein
LLVEKGERRCLAVLRGRKKAPDKERPQRRGGSGAVLLGVCRGRPGTLDDVDLPFADAIKFCFMKPNAPGRADLMGPRQNGLSAASD